MNNVLVATVGGQRGVDLERCAEDIARLARTRPVVVVPGADHFFHRRLHLIRDIVTRAWRH